MTDRILLTRFSKQLDRSAVLRHLSSVPDNPAREKLLACYEQLEPLFWDAIDPKAVIAFSRAPELLEGRFLQTGDAVAYVMSTLGGGVERLAKQYAARREMLYTMALHAMADTYLSGMEPELLAAVDSACKTRGVKAQRWLEAPRHLPIQAQEIAAQETDAFHLLGVSITDGRMLCPVNSSWFLLKLTADCAHISCPNRNSNGSI